MEKADLEALRLGLLQMVEAGALPKLQTEIPEYGPPPLIGLRDCPANFGMPSPTGPTCQLQRVLFPVSACQLQQVRPSNTTMVDLEAQDIAICGILFSHWKQACECEASKQPANLKYHKLARIVKDQWTQCGVRLRAGMHVKQRTNGGYILDGSSLLNMVTRYRSDTKERKAFVAHLQQELHSHYDEVPEPYQPADHNTPLHLHWIKHHFKKKRRRPPVRKKQKVPVVQPAQM